MHDGSRGRTRTGTGRLFGTLVILLLAAFSASAQERRKPGAGAPESLRFSVEAPDRALTGVPFSLTLTARDGAGTALTSYVGTVDVTVGEQSHPARFVAGGGGVCTLADLELGSSGRVTVVVAGREEATFDCLPGVVSILPPLIAIILAFVFRQVLVALVAGIWFGALWIVEGNLVVRSLAVVDTYIVEALTDGDHVSIITFTMLLGAMVGVISRSGGTRGIVQALTVRASSPRAGQITTWLLGLVVFFDDYANSLIVGNTMRPVCDRLKISREKLAYIVDSTAAPVASIALVSTWIGTEIGYIQTSLAKLPEAYQQDPYGVFLESILFRFYPILALVMGFFVAWMGRDFFSMASAERRARVEGKLYRDGADLASGGEDEMQEPDPGAPCRWYNAVIPIALVIVVTMVGLYVTGRDSVEGTLEELRSQVAVASGTDLESAQKELTRLEGAYEGGIVSRLRTIVGDADSYKALLWASFLGTLSAIALALSQRILGIGESMKAVTSGFRAMLPAILILILAWSLASVTEQLNTDDYLIDLLSGSLSPRFLPVLVFITAALVSFSTGTSWGTMAILMPLVVALAHGLAVAAGMEPDTVRLIILGAVSSVLSGAVFGDHCSPISDTTIMSSMATGCDHIDHVKTQLPYAVLVGVVSMGLGDIPTAYGVPPLLALALGSVVLFLAVRFLGKKVDSGPVVK